MGGGSVLGDRNRRGLDEWIARRAVIPYDDEVARTWARLAAAAQRRGRPRPQNDTWVAACCVRHEIGLITVNNRDFDEFRQDGLVVLTERD